MLQIHISHIVTRFTLEFSILFRIVDISTVIVVEVDAGWKAFGRLKRVVWRFVDHHPHAVK